MNNVNVAVVKKEAKQILSFASENWDTMIEWNYARFVITPNKR